MFFRVVDGTVKVGDQIRFMNSLMEYEVLEVGVMTPAQIKVDQLRAGEVGYLSAAIKKVDDARVGDTITLADYHEDVSVLPGY